MNQTGRAPDEWTARIGRAVQNARKDAGLSAAKLSERCSEVGYPIPRNTITNLENGRKGTIPIHEVVTLAVALGVAPIDLIYPVAIDGQLVEDHAVAVEDGNFLVSGERSIVAVNKSRHAMYAELQRRTRFARTIDKRLKDNTLDEKVATEAMELHATMIINAQKDLQLAGLPVPELPDSIAWWFQPGVDGKPRYVIEREDEPVPGLLESKYRHPSRAHLTREAVDDVEHQEEN